MQCAFHTCELPNNYATSLGNQLISTMCFYTVASCRPIMFKDIGNQLFGAKSFLHLRATKHFLIERACLSRITKRLYCLAIGQGVQQELCVCGLASSCDPAARSFQGFAPEECDPALLPCWEATKRNDRRARWLKTVLTKMATRIR